LIRISFFGYGCHGRKASGIIMIGCNLVLICNKKRYRNKVEKIKRMFQITKEKAKK